MNEVIKAMERYGIYKSASVLLSWGLDENSTGLEIRAAAMEYKDFLAS